jgi:hypothetical protein
LLEQKADISDGGLIYYGVCVAFGM